jgi:hypothetical protein
VDFLEADAGQEVITILVLVGDERQGQRCQRTNSQCQDRSAALLAGVARRRRRKGFREVLIRGNLRSEVALTKTSLSGAER